MNTKVVSHSVIDGQLLFQGQAADKQEVAHVMEQAHQAASRWRRIPVAERIETVHRYGEYLTEHRDEIVRLISHEIGKLRWDAAAEVAASIAKTGLSIDALSSRRGDQQWPGAPGGGVPYERQIRYLPIGVALVLGPFNFPLHLPGGQIIPALLSGNSVVFKPSENASAVGKWMADAWRSVGLPDGVLQLLVGDGQTAKHAIDAPDLGGVFLTGSRAAGQSIHRQLAGRPEVMLALELGGNNPVIIEGEMDPGLAANLVSFSAFISSGQRCTCARRAIFISGRHTEDQMRRLCQVTGRLRVGMPRSSEQAAGDEPQLGPLISGAAANSLRQTYTRLVDLGCKEVVNWKVDPDLPALVHPSILDASELDEAGFDSIGEMEWFGPLLVIQQAADFDRAVEAARRTPYGLAASLLGGSQEQFDRFASEVGAGVVNWNGPTTGAAGILPFGGLGQSGNHRPAGYFAIDACSDPVASIAKPQVDANDPWKTAMGK